MTKRQITLRIKRNEREWEEQNKKLTEFFGRVRFIIRREWKIIVDSMMYNKKSNNKTDRTMEQVIWWLKIVGIFFMLKGITYWLTGR